MDTRDLIGKLYDEDVDQADLEKGLDAGTLEELGRIAEAKRAMDALPRRGPSSSSVETVKAYAAKSHASGRSGMSLIFGSRVVRAFAAAAAIIVAVGVGLLTLQPARIAPEVGMGLAEETFSDVPSSEHEARSNTLGKSEFGEPASEEVAAAPPDARQFRDADGAHPGRPDEGVNSTVSPDLTSGFAGEPAPDLGVAEIPLEEAGTLGWDDEREFQTFYWKVQALAERSPDDEWEEGVPLEGSFKAIEGARRDPGWLEANSER